MACSIRVVWMEHSFPFFLYKKLKTLLVCNILLKYKKNIKKLDSKGRIELKMSFIIVKRKYGQ